MSGSSKPPSGSDGAGKQPPSDFQQFRAGFLAEGRELLDIAGPHLLSLEKALRAGRNDPRAVRELFRALHTIKGLSSMVGIEPVVSIAHALENVLRRADRGEARLGLDAIDVVAAGIRAIEQRMAAIERDEVVPPPPADLIRSIDALALVPLQARTDLLDPSDESLAKLTPAEREVLTSALAEGRRAVAIDFAPSSERAARGVDINSVRERVRALGEIVRVLPIAAPAGERSPGGLLFRLIVVTTATDEALADASSGEVRAIGRPGAAPEPLEEPPPIEGDATMVAGVVRVDVERLDAVMNTLSALLVSRFRLEREAERMRAEGADVRELEGILREQRKQLRDLRGHVLRLRTLPVADVLARLPLLVHGAARASGKHVRLEVDAGRAEIDKAVADRLLPALVHLVRNAIDHGIEPPDARRRAGKPEEGLVRVSCHERANSRLELAVTDDGRGVDPEAVARRAGVAPPANDQALLDLLTRPGFSTFEQATTTSGRGLGMDIVRRVATQQLGGELKLETTPGRGATFRLVVPLRLAILDVFAFGCGDQTYVVPVSMVSEIIEVDREAVSTAPGVGPGRTLVQRRSRAVPLVALGELLAVPDAAFPAKAIVVEQEGHPWAFGVDRMLGQHEVVVHTLDHPLVRTPGVTGATDLGDGRPTLVLDLLGLGRSLLDARGTA